MSTCTDWSFLFLPVLVFEVMAGFGLMIAGVALVCWAEKKQR